MKVREDIYVAYTPTLAVLPYNTMIYYPKLKSNNFHHCWETWHQRLDRLDTKFATSFGPVCRIDVQM